MYPWVLDMGKYKSHTESSSPEMRRAVWSDISTPISRQASTAFSETGAPSTAESPALWHSTRSSMPRSTIILRKMPSAMGLRQVLPVQTNKIFIDVQTLLLPAGDNKPPAPFILFSQKRRAPPPDAPLWAPLVLLPGGKGTAFWDFPGRAA